MRLIDADALAKYIDYGHLNSPDAKVYSENDIREMIDMMPTIDKKVDFVRCKECKKVDVVRCKQCRKWTNGDDTYGTCQWNEYNYQIRQTRFDDFCSYGERRT